MSDDNMTEQDRAWPLEQPGYITVMVRYNHDTKEVEIDGDCKTVVGILGLLQAGMSLAYERWHNR